MSRKSKACVAWIFLIVAACSVPGGVADYRESYPLKVDMIKFAVDVRLGAQTTSLSDADSARLARLVREYIRRGRGPIEIATAESDDTADAAAAERMKEFVVREGARPQEIALRRGDSSIAAETVVVSFQGYEVAVPKCGDWSGTAGFNPSNLPHSNFGCSYQRNIGVMLADPGDLNRSDAMGSADAPRSDDIIRKFRVGKGTGAEIPEGERVGASGGKK